MSVHVFPISLQNSVRSGGTDNLSDAYLSVFPYLCTVLMLDNENGLCEFGASQTGEVDMRHHFLPGPGLVYPLSLAGGRLPVSAVSVRVQPHVQHPVLRAVPAEALRGGRGAGYHHGLSE